MAIDVKLPELGDGIDSGDVLEVLVREGDVIKRDQGVVELETDKATVEVPSPQAGRVTKVHVQIGDKVPIGGTLITLEAEVGSKPEAAAPTKPAPPAKEATAKKPEPPTAQPASQTSAQPASPATAQPASQTSAQPASQTSAQPASQTSAQPASQTSAQPASQTSAKPASQTSAQPASPATQPASPAPAAAAAADPTGTIPAGPSVRRFAREVGVDLSQVQGSGDGGRITREDVLAVVRQTSEAARASGAKAKSRGNVATDDWGPVRIEKMSKIRKTIASKMHASWSSAPRVTNFDDADVTELERIRQATKADYAAKDIKLTAMPFLIKACAMALREHPAINATVDVENEQIIYKDYVHIGIAVDTDRGLLVPALRDADQLSIPVIARRLAAMAEKVRAGDIQLEDLRGGTFTISNLGAIGGTYSTPIINIPEVAILLVGRSRKMPVVVNDEIAIRLMMPLSLSYDHRLVDGATAARFLNEVIGYLEAPGRLLLAP